VEAFGHGLHVLSIAVAALWAMALVIAVTGVGVSDR
jgi:hypothetical protein